MSSDLISIASSVFPDSARVIGFRGTEALSRLYEFEIFVAVNHEEVDLADAVGAKAKLILDRKGDAVPPFFVAGVLATVELLHTFQDQLLLRAVLVPQLWQLGLSRHSRVFIKMTVPDVIRAVFDDNALRNYEMRLGSYEVEEHICQYRESDLDFISRWMEREGIYYFFEHGEDGEKLVLSDKRAYDEDVIGVPVRYFPQLGQDRSAGPSFRSFASRHSSLPASVQLRDYDYIKPKLDVSGRANVSDSGTAEVSVYGDRFFSPAAGERLAKLRAEELLTKQVVFHARGSRLHLRPGYTFELEEHPIGSFNTKYLTTLACHHGNQSAGHTHFRELLALEHDEVYAVEIDAILAKMQFRAECRTAWPRIYGFENGVVDGPGDSEYAQIDEHGRYHVKFSFDESGLSSGKASTWVRMMQPHGGDIEGFHYPLRKGTEVVLSFLGGDADRPIIVGVVPNAITPSPVIDANHTQNVVQTGGKNRFEMEDLEGLQYIDSSTPPQKTHIHLGAHHGSHQHNWIVSTDGNGLVHTGADRNITVDGNQTEDVKGNLTEDYHSNQTTHVFSAFEETIDAGATQTISAGSKQTISGGETRDVTGGMTETISGGRTQTINGASTETVNGAVTQTVSAGVTQTFTGALTQEITGGVTTHTPATYKIIADGGMQVIAQGGWQLIAPAGTKTVDSFFDKTGGKSIDAFAFKMSIAGAKVDIVPGLSFGYAANKIDITQLKVDITMAKFANHPIELKTAGQVITAGYLALHGVAFCMIT